jgi:hypothetical protein
MSQKITVHLHLKSGTDSETLEQFMTMQERYLITGVILNDIGGIPADGGSGNYRTFSIDSGDGTKQFFVFDTRTAKDGALTAQTNANMVDGTATAEPIIEAGTAFKMRVSAGGAGDAVNCTASIKLEQYRKF